MGEGHTRESTLTPSPSTLPRVRPTLPTREPKFHQTVTAFVVRSRLTLDETPLPSLHVKEKTSLQMKANIGTGFGVVGFDDLKSLHVE